MPIPFLIPAIIAGASTVAGAALGARAAGKAAKTQAQAAESAAQLQYKAGQEALQFQREQAAQQQTNIQPWLTTGTESLGYLRDLMQPGAQLTQGFDPSTVQMDPGFAFRLAEGQRALERSAAARGGLLSGGSLKALTRYGQDYASSEYDKAYGRAFGTFQANQSNLFNRYASLAGLGQQAVGQLGNWGQQAAGTMGNIAMGTAGAMGDYATQAANARASGYMGGANAWSNALSGLGSNFSQMIMLNSLLNPQQARINPASAIGSTPELGGSWGIDSAGRSIWIPG